MVVLKRLTDAQDDGDRILAVLRASAVNQDGPSSGLTAPNGPAQEAVIRTALDWGAASSPSDISYVECHGTGTQLGDPLEVRALGNVFGPGRDPARPLQIASVKTNIGHVEAAAGIAGLIKTVRWQHRDLPPHLNFTALTPHASAGASRFIIAAQPMEWPAVGRARRAGVSSFGVSGTNAHVVVEQAPAVEPVVGQPAPVVSTLVVSGKTPARVASTAAVLAEWMAVPAPVLGWLMWPTPSIITAPGTGPWPRCVRVITLRRSPGYRHWPPVTRPWAYWTPIRPRADRARCSCIRVRVRNGPAWAGGVG